MSTNIYDKTIAFMTILIAFDIEVDDRTELVVPRHPYFTLNDRLDDSYNYQFIRFINSAKTTLMFAINMFYGRKIC